MEKQFNKLSFIKSLGIIKGFNNNNNNSNDLLTINEELITPTPTPAPTPTVENKHELKEINNKQNVIPNILNKKHINGTNLDHLLNCIGSFGFYQMIQFFLVGIMAIIPSMVAYSYVFVSATPKFTCKTALEISLFHVPSFDIINVTTTKDNNNNINNNNNERSEFLIENKRFIEVLKYNKSNNSNNNNNNTNRIIFDNKCSFTQNEVKIISKSNKLLIQKSLNVTLVRSSLECVEYYYDDSVYGRTLVSDLDLVCIKSYMKAATQNAFILGNYLFFLNFNLQLYIP